MLGTHHVRLTKVSDPSVQYSFTLRTVANGAPDVQLQAVDVEVKGAGIISIPSLHKGSGQMFVGDPEMYWSNEGWEAAYPGVLLSPAQMSTSETITTGSASRQATIEPTAEGLVVGLEGGVWSQVGGVWTLMRAAPTGYPLSGSSARYGNYMFWGTVSDAGISGPVLYRDGSGTFGEATWTASYLVRIGRRLFRVREDSSAGQGYVSWTDEMETANPTFHTEYPFPLQQGSVTAASALGPHILVAIGGGGEAGHILAMDLEGNMTTVVEKGLGGRKVLAMTPYLDGVVVLAAGRPRLLWFRDLLDLDVIEPGGYGPGLQGNVLFNPPAAATANGDALYIMAGEARLMGRLVDGEWSGHQMTNWPTHVLGALAYGDVVEMVNEENGAILHRTWPTWPYPGVPTVGSAAVAALTTSRYSGGTWAVKRFTRLRTPLIYNDGAGFPTVRVLVDGVEVGSFVPTSVGIVTYTLPAAAVGRDVALRFENFPAAFTHHVFGVPIEIEYEVLAEKGLRARLGVQAGQGVTAGGTIDLRSRKDIEAALTSIVAEPSSWTLSWWDGREDWTVVAEDLEGSPLSPEAHPADDEGVYYLTVRRLV